MEQEKRHSEVGSQVHRLSMPVLGSTEDRRIASAPAGAEKKLASFFSSRAGKRGALMVALDDQANNQTGSYPPERVQQYNNEEQNKGRDEACRMEIKTEGSDLRQRPQTTAYTGFESDHPQARGRAQQRPQTSAFTSRQSIPLEARSRDEERPEANVYEGYRYTYLQSDHQEQQRPSSRVHTDYQSTCTQTASIEQPTIPQHEKKGSASSQESTSSATGKSVKKKKTSWFLSRAQDDMVNEASGQEVSVEKVEVRERARDRAEAPADSQALRSNWSDSTEPSSPNRPKKKKRSLLFWKSFKSDIKMSLAGTFVAPRAIGSTSMVRSSRLKFSDKSPYLGPEYGDSPTMTPMNEGSEDKRRQSLASCGVDEAVGQRNIVTHHNWLARLFRVKPLTEHLCFSISRKRARQEVTLILRQWRKYGIRDIQVDRKRNMIFARVGPKNCETLSTFRPI